MNGKALRVALAHSSRDSAPRRSRPCTWRACSARRWGARRRTTREATPEPFAREAKHNAEVRLLHRDVLVIFEGEDKYKNLFCTIRVTNLAEGAASEDVAEFLRERAWRGSWTGRQR